MTTEPTVAVCALPSDDGDGNAEMDMQGPYYIEFGDVWKRNAAGGTPDHVCDANGELAVAMADGVMYRNGSAEAVERWYAAKGAASGFDIEIVRFPVTPETVEELNLCSGNSTRAQHLLERLKAIGEADPSLERRPRFPK